MKSKTYYQNERLLQNKLLELSSNLCRHFDTAIIKREVPIGNIKPDFICITFNSKPIKISKCITYKDANILHVLRKRNNLKIDTISRKLFISPDKIRSNLNKLVTLGILVQSPTACFKISDNFKSNIAEVLSIEAKLTDWKEALRQSISYKPFSDRVLVVMDSEGYSNSNVKLDEFRKNGVGLLLVNSKAAHWILYPRKNSEKKDPYWDYLLYSSLKLVD